MRVFNSETDALSDLNKLINDLPEPDQNAFSLREVSRTEVLSTLKALRTDSSTGPDKIPIKFVKIVADTIAGPLTTIINNCIRRSYFPNAWQIARISPIPKIDQPIVEEHFRPISILPALSKVFEKLVAVQMTKFCEDEAFLRDTISGFRKGHSTCTVLMAIRDDLLRVMKKGEITLMVLADFSKAFDTVRYGTLIRKLSCLGFSKSYLKWLTSYLSNHSHFVQIDDRMSSKATVQFGIPRAQFLGQCSSIYMSLTCKTACRFRPPPISMQTTPPSIQVAVLLIYLNLLRQLIPLSVL